MVGQKQLKNGLSGIIRRLRSTDSGTAMSFDKVTPGDDLPNEINVIVEIPMNSPAIKYEVDKATGAIFVDRMLKTAMHYPCNYGYIPHTLSGDGDPADVLVVMPMPLVPGCVVKCRPVGLLKMHDEAGEDGKLIAVPVTDITGIYRDVHSVEDLPDMLLNTISHFFDHYKDLEQGKWVKIEGWHGVAAAHEEITSAVERYNSSTPRPNF
jgi:inorganic pyrophosphatase